MIKVITNYFHLQSQTILYISSCTMPRICSSQARATFCDTGPTPPLTPSATPGKDGTMSTGRAGCRKGDKSQLTQMSQRSPVTTPQHCAGCRDDTNCSSAPFKDRGSQKLEMQDVVYLWRLGDTGQLILMQLDAEGFAFSNYSLRLVCDPLPAFKYIHIPCLNCLVQHGSRDSVLK